MWYLIVFCEWQNIIYFIYKKLTQGKLGPFTFTAVLIKFLIFLTLSICPLLLNKITVTLLMDSCFDVPSVEMKEEGWIFSNHLGLVLPTKKLRKILWIPAKFFLIGLSPGSLHETRDFHTSNEILCCQLQELILIVHCSQLLRLCVLLDAYGTFRGSLSPCKNTCNANTTLSTT
jgi:hypothetical protein